MPKPYQLSMRPRPRPEAVVAGKTYRFTVLTSRLIRMEYQRDGRFVDEPTQTVLNRDLPTPPYRVLETENSLEIVTEKLHLYYDKQPFANPGLRVELQESHHVYGSSWSYGDRINDLKGTVRTLDMADGAVELESGLMSLDGFTLLDDSRTVLLTEDGWVAPRPVQGQDLYFFGYGHDYLACLRDFYRLSGFTPLLPRYVLGNWWSRFYKYTEESYLKVIDRFRAEDIPLSVAVIDMDWHITDIPAKYGSGWTGYTWNPDYFPDPGRFLAKLHERGLRVTLSEHPADGVKACEEVYPTMAAALGHDTSNEDKIPFDATDRRFIEAYFKYLHYPNEALGVDFWWLDWQQTPVTKIKGLDNLWMINHLHFLDSGKDGKRPLTFSRYAGIGSHRYPIGFSGDSFNTWASLDFQPYFTATASNVGYTWWSHDIGGHQGGRKDDELTTRWVQFGVFSPIMRLHSNANEFYLKEPWGFGPEAQGIMTDFLRLRHKLLPYLYTMNYLTALEGLPLVQPVYYQVDRPDSYLVPNEYYFGTQLIVCPITKPRDPATLLGEFDAYLPEGASYFDFFSGRHYRGTRRMKLHRGLESLPVLAKEGAIVPLAADYRTSHLQNPEELEIHVFNGAPGAFTLYEDKVDERLDPDPTLTDFAFAPGREASFTVSLRGEAEGVIPARRRYTLLFRGFEAPEAVSVAAGEEPLPFEQSYDEAAKTLRVSFVGGQRREIAVKAATPGGRVVSPALLPAVYDLLLKSHLPYVLKAQVYDAVRQEPDALRLLGRLHQMELEGNLFGALAELLTAEA